MSQPDAGKSSIGAPQAAPALLARMCTPPGSSSPSSASSRTHSSFWDRSAAIASTFPNAASSATAASAGRREVT